MQPIDLQTFENTALALAKEATSDYRQAFTEPATNLFTGKPLREQLPQAARMLRSGDCLLQALRLVEQGRDEAQACALELEASMLEVAARAVRWERPGKIENDEQAQSVFKGATGFQPGGKLIFSEAIRVHLVDGEGVYPHVWEPLREALAILRDAHLPEASGAVLKALAGAQDDNDIACAIGIGRRAYLEHYYATNEEASGAIAYELLARDNAVMGSPMQVSRDTFLEHEMGRRAGAKVQRMGM